VKPDRVEVAFLHAAGRLVGPKDLVVVGCSGGGDSMALLRLLHRLSARRRPALIVAHLDHGLRRGSKADLEFVRRAARELDLPFVGERREVPKLRRRGESPEEAARRVRRAFLLEAVARHGATKLALGHTLDDQAETILMRLARGAGPTALLGMREAGPGPIVRPLLDVERAALRSWLARRRIDYREDPSNESLRFERNRVRKLVMTVLAAKVNPKAARHIVEGMRRLREDADYLDAAARAAAETSGAASLESLPKPLAERVRRLLVC